MDHLRVYNSPYNIIRLGKKGDGGYIICDIGPEYDLMLAGGVGKDISFEVAFLKKYPSVNGFAFDGTIEKLPNHNLPENSLIFIKKNLGNVNTEKITTLNTYFLNNNNIFVKMAIDGGENKLFETISDDNLLNIKQLVIKFHSPRQVIIQTRLAKTHWLVHFHANNCCGTTIIDGIVVPNVYECTYVRKNPGENFEYNTNPIHDPLFDQSNTRRPEIVLLSSPFVNSPVKKCLSVNCNYVVHTNKSNNGGNHCCKACKLGKEHGPACNKIDSNT